MTNKSARHQATRAPAAGVTGTSRRRFLAGSALGTGGAVMMATGTIPSAARAAPAPTTHASTWPPPVPVGVLGADPGNARWLWFPSQRTLPNTVVLFRKEISLDAKPEHASVWVTADSRYRLYVNGTRVAFGPAPCDPRVLEVDPIDLAPHLVPGTNVIGAEVLFYGHGDGTWPGGKPGFLLHGSIVHGARAQPLFTDESWQCALGRAWRPGQYNRWYLRALQEEHDARLYPEGWNRPGFVPDASWRTAMVLDVPARYPPIAGRYRDHLGDINARREDTGVVARSIARLQETVVSARFLESHGVRWHVPPRDYFDFEIPDACTITPGPRLIRDGASLRFTLDGRDGVALTFDLPEQMVGFPGLSVQAPAGTQIELLFQEGHTPGGPPIMNTHRSSWTRLICREGRNDFECFDYESCRFLQLHFHGATGPIVLYDVTLRRRYYPFAHAAHIETTEPALARLTSAGLNTIVNCAQETIVDGMGRERQQYSGDIGHVLHVLHLFHGETALPARFLSTFARGMTHEGFFLDCWPAYDRLVRIAQRQMRLSPWGPILDHGIGFVFDAFHHYTYSGSLDEVRAIFPVLVRFARYLAGLRSTDGLLPVTGLGIPIVWMDHDAYVAERHKQCAFNLYAAAMYGHALLPLAQALGETAIARSANATSKALLAAAVRRFWDPGQRIFVASRPWQKEDGVRLDDRALATAILYDQCPGRAIAPALAALASPPAHMGISYPANAVWRMWALARGDRCDVILHELRTRWARLRSVLENNTLSEHWEVTPDTHSQWSHAPVAPLLALVHGLWGLQVDEPGMSVLTLRPRLHDLDRLALTVYTPRGPLALASTREDSGNTKVRTLDLHVPEGTHLALNVDPREALALPRIGRGRFHLGPGLHHLVLRYPPLTQPESAYGKNVPYWPVWTVTGVESMMAAPGPLAPLGSAPRIPFSLEDMAAASFRTALRAPILARTVRFRFLVYPTRCFALDVGGCS